MKRYSWRLRDVKKQSSTDPEKVSTHRYDPLFVFEMFFENFVVLQSKRDDRTTLRAVDRTANAPPWYIS